MSKLFRMIGVGLIAVVLMAWSVASVWAASPPQPTYGTAVVDGDHVGEWDLTNDWFADMYESADPTKDVISKLYLRYDCSTSTLYGLVLVESGHTIDVYADPTPGEEHFIKINGSKIVDDGDQPADGTPPDFEWIALSGTTADGWEASAYLDPGTYDDLDVHTQVDEDQTSAVEGRAIDLEIECVSITIIKEVYNYYGIDVEDDQDFGFTGDLGEFTLDDYITSTTTLKSITFSNLITGTYVVTETEELVADWGVTDIVCTSNTGGSTFTVALPAVTIELGTGDGVTCTFNNAPLLPPTAVTLSSFAANSSAGGSVNPLWLGLAGTVLAAGSLFWAKRRD